MSDFPSAVLCVLKTALATKEHMRSPSPGGQSGRLHSRLWTAGMDATWKANQHARAARNNMGVVRFFGFPAMRGFNLQTRPGQYTEQAFVGIDRVIAAAADHGFAPPRRACP